MPDRLYFTHSEEANELIASDPMALLVGFALDQQVSVEKAFSGPLALRERLGSLEAAKLARADLEPVFREKPAIHRFPGSMARRVHDLAVHVRDRYDGDAARVWTDAANAEELRANLEALPGFGEMKVKALGAVLAKRYRGRRRPTASCRPTRRSATSTPQRRWPTTRRPRRRTRPSGAGCAEQVPRAALLQPPARAMLRAVADPAETLSFDAARGPSSSARRRHAGRA